MRKIISLLLVVVLCLSLAVTAFADEFVSSPGTSEDCQHGSSSVVNKKDPTCTENGYTGDKVCDNCGKVLEKGKVIPKLGHKFVDGVCSVCGAKEGAPQTGDSSNMVLWMGVMIVAAVAMSGAVMSYRKKFANR